MDLINTNVKLSLDVVHCYDEGDGPGDAEPYLWTVFFKVDGDSVTFNTDTLRLETRLGRPFNITIPPRATVKATSGSQGNLNNTDVSDGESVFIPASIGQYNTILKPIPFSKPLLGMTQTGGMIGCIAILMEEDNTPNQAILAGYEALRTNVATKLSELLRQVTITSPDISEDAINGISAQIGNAVRAAIKDQVNAFEFIFGFGDMDEQIGSKVFRFTHRELQAANPFSQRFKERWDNEGSWEIYGHVFAFRT
ncbi:hypothetical protein W97_03349 [Coniosporium apollinis CBS 100218]|uniref:Uncharacterized protein n=1 Tax=Coniosporium apollinis (strain CBS 100218) TaxID=1168221 RepID=R7YQP9_CONA1|nr:uncharacterized protein W97_03349 [Coniosporium apollinis CBS 100218]EON64119.1 hypothetical protein W97_03349 [Coniosporium apollinis CBS 100218]